MPYTRTVDSITLPIQDMFELLEKAAREGIRIGEANTAGDHTESGLAYTVFREYLAEEEE